MASPCLLSWAGSVGARVEARALVLVCRCRLSPKGSSSGLTHSQDSRSSVSTR